MSEEVSKRRASTKKIEPGWGRSRPPSRVGSKEHRGPAAGMSGDYPSNSLRRQRVHVHRHLWVAIRRSSSLTTQRCRRQGEAAMAGPPIPGSEPRLHLEGVAEPKPGDVARVVADSHASRSRLRCSTTDQRTVPDATATRRAHHRPEPRRIVRPWSRVARPARLYTRWPHEAKTQGEIATYGWPLSLVRPIGRAAGAARLRLSARVLAVQMLLCRNADAVPARVRKATGERGARRAARAPGRRRDLVGSLGALGMTMNGKSSLR